MNLHEKIYKVLAKKYGKPFDVIEKACRSQSEFTSNVIESGSKFSVRWKYFGIWGVKKKRQEHLDGDKKQKTQQQEPSGSENS
jgi:hypothetical protein